MKIFKLFFVWAVRFLCVDVMTFDPMIIPDIFRRGWEEKNLHTGADIDEQHSTLVYRLKMAWSMWALVMVVCSPVAVFYVLDTTQGLTVNVPQTPIAVFGILFLFGVICWSALSYGQNYSLIRSQRKAAGDWSAAQNLLRGQFGIGYERQMFEITKGKPYEGELAASLFRHFLHEELVVYAMHILSYQELCRTGQHKHSVSDSQAVTAHLAIIKAQFDAFKPFGFTGKDYTPYFDEARRRMSEKRPFQAKRRQPQP